MSRIDAPSTPERVFPMLHRILVFGVALTVVVLGVVRTTVSLDPPADLTPLLRLAALALLVGGYVMMRVVRARITPLGAGADRRSWWVQESGKIVLVWAIAEGIAMTGAICWFLTGDLVMLIGVVGAALAVLVMNRPGRLMEG